MKNIKKSYRIKAEPEFVYAALTNSVSIEFWMGGKAVMLSEPNTEFSLCDDSICGMNLEFVENQKIVQQWYFAEEAEKSIVTLTLAPDKQGTLLELLHTNIPDEAFENIVEGWDESYIKLLKDFVEEE